MLRAILEPLLEEDVIRIVLVVETGLWRGALAAVLAAENDFEVVADTGRIEETTPLAKAVLPDVVIADIDLVAKDVPTVAAELYEAVPGCATLVLAGTDSPGMVRAALDSHVSGIVCKDCGPNALIRYVRQAAKGERVIDPMLAATALRTPRNPLTERERDVLRVASLGVPSVEIAGCLHLTVGTVRNYMSSIMRKTGARNRVEAIRIANDTGWL
jgi:two-component system response regulator DesR